VERLEDSELRQLYADPAAAARQARDKIAAARVWLMKHKPFFGVLARAFRIEPTLAVIAYRLFADDRLLCNPIAVASSRFPALCARLAHLSLHAALAAFARRQNREPRRWNVACDLAIAPMLEAAELSVGRAPSALIAELGLPPGASAEAFYRLLPDGVSPEPAWCDLSDRAVVDDLERMSIGQHRDIAGEDGLELDPTGSPFRQPTSIDAGKHELEWKMRLAAAYEEDLARGSPTFGDAPLWLDEMLRATIEPPADWSVQLQQSIHLLHRTDRSYLRPSRRTSALIDADGVWPDVVTIPGRRIEHAGRLCVVIDTSASLPSGTLARFFGAVVAAATAESIDELRLLQADATVTRDEVVFAAELLFRPIEICGRGGTDFAPALLKLAEESRREGMRFTAVYLTDLEGRFPPASAVSSLDVLWVVPAKTDAVAPFGRVVEMVGR
jgi:predicted metal-dependent peptidase